MNGRRGGALPAALATLAFSAALAAALADLVRTELRLMRERRTAALLLAQADGCLARATAALPAGWDFDAVVAGEDGVAGTPDDGVVPGAGAGCAAIARRPPGSVEPPRMIVQVEARSGVARRALDGLVARAAEPGAPSLLWLGGVPETGAVPGSLALDGEDPAAPDAAIAALAAPVAPEALDGWVAGEAERVTTTARTLPPAAAPPPPLAALADRLRGAPAAGPEALLAAGPAAPGVIVVDGDLAIDAPRIGAGILLVTGRLEVRAALEFAGVVAAADGVDVRPGGLLAVDGTLWVAGAASLLRVEGSLTLRHSRDAIAAADGLSRLPRRAVIGATRDLT